MKGCAGLLHKSCQGTFWTERKEKRKLKKIVTEPKSTHMQKALGSAEREKKQEDIPTPN